MSDLYNFQSDPKVSQQWVTVLLHACSQSKIVLKTTAEKVTTPELVSVMHATTAQAILYQSFVAYWREYEDIPAPAVLAVAVSNVISQLPPVLHQQKIKIIEEIQQLSAVIFSPPQGDCSQIAMDIIKFVYMKSRIEPEMVLIASRAKELTVDQLFQYISDLRSKTVSNKVPKNVFSLNKERSLSIEFSSGLSWFDDLIGGGFRSGEGYGILAETGGGKTTLAVQLSCSLAAQGRRVLLIVTEQSFQEHTLRAKFWSAVTKMRWKEFEKYNDISEIPEDVIPSSVKESIKKIQSNIFGFDLDDVHSISDVNELVIQYKPDVFIIDWAGTLADHLMSDRNNPWHNDRHLCLRAIANEVNNLSKFVGSAGVIFHQLKPDTVRNPFRNYDHTQAAECKTFCWNLSFGIVMHPRDANNVMKIACTKSRLGARTECLVRMDGATCSFEHLIGYKKSARKGVWVKEQAEMQSLPTYDNRI